MDVDPNASAPVTPAPEPSGRNTAGGIPAMRPADNGPVPGWSLRPMRPDDLPFVVAEHRVHFPEGFFARLGPRFLTAYTATYLSMPLARAYVIDVDGRPVGFLVGVLDPPAHRRRVLRTHSRRLALRAAAALAVRPGLALHFARTRLKRYAGKLLPARRSRGAHAAPKGRRRHTGQAGHARRDGLTAVLNHVVVADSVRSRGLGTALVDRFVRDAASAGCARVSLVTASGPDGAGRYYERLGWQLAGETSTPDGRRFATYEYPLAVRIPNPAEPRHRGSAQ